MNVSNKNGAVLAILVAAPRPTVAIVVMTTVAVAVGQSTLQRHVYTNAIADRRNAAGNNTLRRTRDPGEHGPSKLFAPSLLSESENVAVFAGNRFSRNKENGRGCYIRRRSKVVSC